jgi:hypothetical protein
MNGRGQYGNHAANGYGRTYVGADLVQVLTLKQRYDHVKTGGVVKLLSTLAKNGTQTAIGEHHWQIALRNAGWVDVHWYPQFNGLEVSITDREVHRDDEVPSVRRDYEKVLQRITPLLQTYGATTVGGAFAEDFPVPHPLVGLTLYHSVGDRADAVKQMAIDWDALYASLAPQVGDVTDPMGGPMGGKTSGAAKAREEELAAYKVVDSWQPLLNEVYRIEKLLNAAGIDKKITWKWREESDPPYADIVMYAAGKAEPLKQQFLAAKKALDTFMPRAQRRAAIARARDLTEKRGQAVQASFDPAKVAWWKSYALPLFRSWTKFKHEQIGGDRTVADAYISFAERFQTNWDVYENWKKKLDNLRTEAEKRGFAVDAPKPTELSTTVWPDAGGALKSGASKLAEGAGDVWKTVKYGVWGALGIGAIVALTSVFSNLRSGKDPADKYMELVRQGRRSSRSPRKLPAGRDQLALASGRRSSRSPRKLPAGRDQLALASGAEDA